DFKTNCIDVGGSAQCPSLDATRTDSLDGDTVVTTQKNVRIVRGGTCDDWNANPARFSGGSAAPSATSSKPGPTGTGGSTGGGGGPASAGSAGGPVTAGGGAPPTANVCDPRSSDTPCTTCFKSSCCDAFTACAANQSCLAIVQCAAKCTDDTCLQSCASG